MYVLSLSIEIHYILYLFQCEKGYFYGYRFNLRNKSSLNYPFLKNNQILYLTILKNESL